jgi:fido (protein-threonine AMPylation protein)
MVRRHAEILRGRPTLGPGEFKTKANRAGSYDFVSPEYVVGTLRAGWERIDKLSEGWGRALMTMFVVAEVHPFNDGNGRTARVMMNAELSAAQLSRMLIPVRLRDEYMGALRGMSRQSQADRYVRALELGWRWTAGIDFTDPATARGQIEATNALVDPAEGDERGMPLRFL